MTSPPATAAQITRVRDLLVFDDSGVRLVVACDSVGGIGPKPADTVPVDATCTGYFAARVPLLEVLCAGAQPVVVANNLCVEAEPTGRELTEAVRAIAASVGVPAANVTGLIHDAVPVGSKGLAWEAPLLASTAGLELRWEPGNPVPPERSGGPSSCVLVSCAPADLDRLRACFAETLPVAVVGTLAEAAETTEVRTTGDVTAVWRCASSGARPRRGSWPSCSRRMRAPRSCRRWRAGWPGHGCRSVPSGSADSAVCRDGGRT